MALITDLPTTSAPSTSDYMITDTGSATQKCTIANIKASMGISSTMSSGLTQISNNASATATLSNNSRGMFFVTATSANPRCMYIFNVSSAGAVTTTPVLAPSSGISFTTGTNTLTIANSSGGAIFPTFIMTMGTITI